MMYINVSTRRNFQLKPKNFVYLISANLFLGTSASIPMKVYVSNHTYYFDTQRCGFSRFHYNKIEKGKPESLFVHKSQNITFLITPSKCPF